jgi:hypothetical protein
MPGGILMPSGVQPGNDLQIVIAAKKMRPGRDEE